MSKSRFDYIRKSLIFIGVFYLIIHSISMVNAQTCLPGGITFTSQTQINNFASNYPGCSQILGNVTINGSGITNLNGLSQITSINGNLNISRCNATSLSGLQNLTSIGGGLIFNVPPTNQYFNYLPNLNSIAALSNLTTIGGSLSLVYMPSLTSLNGLQSLTSVGGDIQISIVPITSLSVFQNLNHVTGSLTIASTQVSNFSGLENITSIGGSLNFSGNNVLNSIAALSNLTTIGGTLVLGQNTALTSLNGLGGLTSFQSLYTYNTGLTTLSPLAMPASIPGNIEINSENLLLSSSGWQSLTSVGGNMNFGFSNGNLAQFSGLATIGGDLQITGMNTLTNLVGLSALNMVNGNVVIGQNPVLLSLDGLNAGLTIGGDLSIYLNDVLGQCAAQAICDYLQAPAGLVDIHYNLPDCNSVAQVEADCNDDPPACTSMITPAPGSTGVGVNTNIEWEDATNLAGAGYILNIGTTPGGGELLNNQNVGDVLLYNPSFSLPYNSTIYVKISPFNQNGTNNTCAVQSFTTVDVCPANLDLYSQNDVNQFPVNYPSCVNVPGYVTIGFGDITNLTPLNQIESINGDLYIGGNDNMTILNGLANLMEINGALYIEGNAALTGINGFDNLNNIAGDLNIWFNPLLSDCVANGICQYVDMPNGIITIVDNGAGCNSATEVETACLAALPVELVYWYAKPQKTAIHLHFGAEIERQHTHFIIEHSADGIHFVPIGQVKAEDRHDYSFIHQTPFLGLNYYRLQSIDQNGQSAYSTIISARLNTETIQVSPNPGNGKFVINGHLPEKTRIQLMDAQGRIWMRSPLVGRVLDLSELPSGMYLLQVLDETNGETGRTRLLKTD